MKLVPVVVYWTDATSDDDWKDIEEHQEGGLSDIATMGFLISETKDYIVVCLSIDLDNDQASSAITIPKKWTTKVRRLRVKV